jgi:acetyl esterase
MRPVDGLPDSYVALDPDVRAFLSALPPPGGEPPDASAARAGESHMQAIDVPRVRADIEDGVIHSEGMALDIRIVRPHAWRNGPLPIVLYVHGGGWVVGGKDTHDRVVRELASGAEAAVVFLDYSRSPEARYPRALEEAYATLTWLKGHGRRLGLDPARIALVGDSAGGNIVAAVTLLARERGGPAIDLQVLLCPVTDASFAQSSYADFADGYFLRRALLEWAWDQYAPDASARAEATASPLRAAATALTGLPPALIVTAECDIVRDEGEAYARRLIAAGVRVTATRYLGTIHAFTVLNPLAHTAATRAAIAQVNGALRDALA